MSTCFDFNEIDISHDAIFEVLGNRYFYKKKYAVVCSILGIHFFACFITSCFYVGEGFANLQNLKH